MQKLQGDCRSEPSRAGCNRYVKERFKMKTAKKERKRRHQTRPSRSTTPQLAAVRLSTSSQAARDRALHVIATMRREPKISLTHAAKLQGVKPGTVKKYFPAALRRSHGRLRATKGDRYKVTLHVPNAQGHSVAVTTRSSKDREALSRYLRDLGHYLRGNRNALSHWNGQTIAGVKLVTDPRTLTMIEPALSEFSLYRTANGGAG